MSKFLDKMISYVLRTFILVTVVIVIIDLIGHLH
jgi:hypothetical protein